MLACACDVQSRSLDNQYLTPFEELEIEEGAIMQKGVVHGNEVRVLRSYFYIRFRE